MGLISLVAALLLEQWRPLAGQRHLYSQVARYANFLERQFNAGEPLHGLIAWIVAILPAPAGVMCGHFRDARSQGIHHGRGGYRASRFAAARCR